MSDKRKYTRHPIELSVAFTGDEVCGQGVVVDLSTGGCRVKTAAAVLSGEFLGMLIALPGRDRPLSIGLTAVRWSIGQEIGVEFIRMDAEQQALLQSFLAKLDVGRSLALTSPTA